jgi:hypothetical protein
MVPRRSDPKFNIHDVPHYESKGYIQNDLYARERDLELDDIYNQRLETQEDPNESRPTIIVPSPAATASPPPPVLTSESGSATRLHHQPPAVLVVSVRPGAAVKRDD